MRSFVSVGIFWLLILLYLNSAVLTNGIQRETWSEVSPARNSLQRNLDYCQPLITIEDCRLEQVCIEEAVVKVCEKKVWICPASSNFENASPKEKYGLSKNARTEGYTNVRKGNVPVHAPNDCYQKCIYKNQTVCEMYALKNICRVCVESFTAEEKCSLVFGPQKDVSGKVPVSDRWIPSTPQKTTLGKVQGTVASKSPAQPACTIICKEVKRVCHQEVFSIQTPTQTPTIIIVKPTIPPTPTTTQIPTPMPPITIIPTPTPTLTPTTKPPTPTTKPPTPTTKPPTPTTKPPTPTTKPPTPTTKPPTPTTKPPTPTTKPPTPTTKPPTPTTKPPTPTRSEERPPGKQTKRPCRTRWPPSPASYSALGAS